MIDVGKSADITSGNKIWNRQTIAKAPGSDFMKVQDMVIKEVLVHNSLEERRKKLPQEAEE